MTAPPNAVPPIPEGTSTVMPWIISRDTAKLLEFMKQAFGAQELSSLQNEDGTTTYVSQTTQQPYKRFDRLQCNDGRFLPDFLTSQV